MVRTGCNIESKYQMVQDLAADRLSQTGIVQLQAKSCTAMRLQNWDRKAFDVVFPWRTLIINKIYSWIVASTDVKKKMR